MFRFKCSWVEKLAVVFVCFCTIFYGNGGEAFAQSSSNSDAAIKQAEDKLDSQGAENAQKSSYLPPNIAKTPLFQRSSVSEKSSGELSIPLRSIELRGAKSLQEEVLKACYTSYIGKTIGEGELNNITECLTNKYHHAGYSLSRAVIPRQDARYGQLIVQLIEGYISNVKFVGGDAARFGAVRFAAPIMAQKPTTQSHLERHLLLISDIPGVALEDTELEEMGLMSGVFELTIKIKTWEVWSGSDLDNRGDDAIGPYQSYQSVSLNSLFGRGETIRFGYSSIVDSVDELNFAQASFDLPLNVDGMRLSAFVSGSVSEPDDEQKLTHTKFKTFDAAVNLQWALLRKQKTSFWFGGGVWARSNQEQNDSGTYVDDALYGVSLFARGTHNDHFGGQSSLYVNLRQGLDLGDVSHKGDANLSRFDGDGEFTKLYIDMTRNQVLDENWSLFASGALQLASEGLLSSQEFYVGGSRFGRAYASGVLSGDSGAAASIELRYSKEIENEWLNGFQLYGFADVGSIFDEGNSYMNGAVVSSAGFGARLYLKYGVEIDLAAAFPIDDDGLSAANDTEFFFQISRNFKLSELRFDRGFSLLDQMNHH